LRLTKKNRSDAYDIAVAGLANGGANLDLARAKKELVNAIDDLSRAGQRDPGKLAIYGASRASKHILR
jgi:hypothetical protein